MATTQDKLDANEHHNNDIFWVGLYYPLIIVFLVAICHGSLVEVRTTVQNNSKALAPEDPSFIQEATQPTQQNDLQAPKAATETRKDATSEISHQIGLGVASQLHDTDHAGHSDLEYDIRSISFSISDVTPGSIAKSSSTRGRSIGVEAVPPIENAVLGPTSHDSQRLMISSTSYQALQFILHHRMGGLATRIIREDEHSTLFCILVFGFTTFAIGLSVGKYHEFWDFEKIYQRGFMQKFTDQLLFLNYLGLWSMFIPWLFLLNAAFW